MYICGPFEDIIGLVVHVGAIIPGMSKEKPNKRRILRLEDLKYAFDCFLLLLPLFCKLLHKLYIFMLKL